MKNKFASTLVAGVVLIASMFVGCGEIEMVDDIISSSIYVTLTEEATWKNRLDWESYMWTVDDFPDLELRDVTNTQVMAWGNIIRQQAALEEIGIVYSDYETTRQQLIALIDNNEYVPEILLHPYPSEDRDTKIILTNREKFRTKLSLHPSDPSPESRIKIRKYIRKKMAKTIDSIEDEVIVGYPDIVVALTTEATWTKDEYIWTIDDFPGIELKEVNLYNDSLISIKNKIKKQQDALKEIGITYTNYDETLERLRTRQISGEYVPEDLLGRYNDSIYLYRYETFQMFLQLVFKEPLGVKGFNEVKKELKKRNDLDTSTWDE
ncbi:MAG: hypothetical protein FWH14_07625 [Oscillospiraceae bacterium]|nr:hypothetical protein [Oscillospiraceae bacterium]